MKIILICLILLIFSTVSPKLPNSSCLSCKKSDSIFATLIQSPYFTGFQLYKSPAFTVISAHQLLMCNAKDQPAGLQLNFKIDPQKVYSFKLDADLIEGNVIIRLEKNGRLSWINCSNISAAKELLISDTPNLSILFYSDHPYKFKLNSIKLTKTNYKTDADLKNQILEDCPSLALTLKENRLKAANIILDWAANHIVFALDRNSSKQISGSEDAYSYYNDFINKSTGVFCGGSAYFLTKIYHLFGIEAFAIDSGYLKNNLTHVTTVVAIQENNKYKYYLFDPTFNIYFYNKTNSKLASLEELLSAFENNNFQKLIGVKRNYLNRDYLSLTKNTQGIKKTLRMFKIKNSDCHFFGGKIICKLHEDFLQNYLARITRASSELNLASDDTLLIRFLSTQIFNISDPISIQAKIDFIKLCQSHNIKIDTTT